MRIKKSIWTCVLKWYSEESENVNFDIYIVFWGYMRTGQVWKEVETSSRASLLPPWTQDADSGELHHRRRTLACVGGE